MVQNMDDKTLAWLLASPPVLLRTDALYHHCFETPRCVSEISSPRKVVYLECWQFPDFASLIEWFASSRGQVR